MDSIRNDLMLMERELIVTVSGDDRSVAHIFCDDPVWFARLRKWFRPTFCDGKSATFDVSADLILRVSALVNGNQRLEDFAGGDTCENSSIAGILTPGNDC